MINLGNIKISDLRLGTSQVKAVYFGSEQVWSREEQAGGWLCFTAEQDGSTLRLDKVGSPAEIYLETSNDEGATWKDYGWPPDNTGSEYTNLNVGDKIYFRAKTENKTIGSSSTDYYKFVMTGLIAASGNILTLLKADGSKTDAPAYCYYSMFQGCTSLTTAPELPATILANSCYLNMFNGCKSLTTAPTLPATKLVNRCYLDMFNGCTSLTQAPELPATTLAGYCYSGMFANCKSLTTAPELPATTLAGYCYLNMFSNCTSLTQAPALPATTLIKYCYKSMFSVCSSLTQAPELPATTLADYCYLNMFSNCTSLTTTPELPATTLADYCYTSMFSDCTLLTTAPELPATTLASNCYRSMFSNCTSLTTAPELPATTLIGGCYRSMFEGCTSLTTAPNLPATTLINNCYTSMFSGCTSLTTAPALSATTLEYGCYSFMFQGCTSLTSAPALPATTLADSCYYYMFDSCSNLSSINVSFTVWEPTNATTGWVKGVAASGTFTCPAELPDTRGTSNIPVGWTVVNPVASDWLCFTALEPGSTVQLTKVGSAPAVNLQTSTDGKSWTPYTVEDTITLANVDDKVYFKAVGSNSVMGSSASNYNKFVMTGKIAASGNINSLLEEDEETARTMSLAGENYCYSSMFYNCTSLTQAPELPATTLAYSCYSSMFLNCSSLTQAPELPATTLANKCYASMFYGCTSLTQAPELPATTLTDNCYFRMFINCKSLTAAPALPATTLASNCYSSMFQGCSKLASIDVSFTAWEPTNATDNWVNSVAASGTFTCPAALPDTRGISNIPEGWTKVDAA